MYKQKFGGSLGLDGEKESHNINKSNSIDLLFFKECQPTQTVRITISKETVHNFYDNIVCIHSLGYKIMGTNFAEGIDWEDKKFKQIAFEQLEKLCQYYITIQKQSQFHWLTCVFLNAKLKNRKKWCGGREQMAADETDISPINNILLPMFEVASSLRPR